MTKYQDDPDACDFSEFMVVTNAISRRKDIIALFRQNKLGIDVDVSLHRLCLISPTHRTIIALLILMDQHAWKVMYH
jgi:hypothetical protein